MARGRNPDGTPKRYPSESTKRHRPIPQVEAQVRREAQKREPPALSQDNPPLDPRAGISRHWTENPAILSRLEVVEGYRDRKSVV